MADIDIYTKPNLRSKGKRYGVRSSSRVYWNIHDFNEKRKQGYILRKKENPLNNNEKNRKDNFEYDIGYSLNKAKRWELVEELKKDPKVKVVEYNRNLYSFRTAQCAAFYEESSSDDEEEEYTLVKSRKGITIRKKRKKGKKGVKKVAQKSPHPGQIGKDIEVIYTVEKPQNSKKYPMYSSQYSGYVSPDWMKGITKNHNVKRRREKQKIIHDVVHNKL